MLASLSDLPSCLRRTGPRGGLITHSTACPPLQELQAKKLGNSWVKHSVTFRAPSSDTSSVGAVPATGSKHRRGRRLLRISPKDPQFRNSPFNSTDNGYQNTSLLLSASLRTFPVLTELVNVGPAPQVQSLQCHPTPLICSLSPDRSLLMHGSLSAWWLPLRAIPSHLFTGTLIARVPGLRTTTGLTPLHRIGSDLPANGPNSPLHTDRTEPHDIPEAAPKGHTCRGSC